MKVHNSAIVSSATATIDTLSVTIRALHVNGKQMTLAVFRQLPEGEHDEQNEYWGIVHYHIKDEGSRWLVFSRDGRLFRRQLKDWRFRVQKLWEPAERRLAELETKNTPGLYRPKIFHEGEWVDLTPELFENLSRNLRAEIYKDRRQYVLDCEYEAARYEREKQLALLPQLFIAV